MGHDAPVTPNPLRFHAAIDAFRNRVPVSREQWDRLNEEERDFAFTVSGVSQANLVAQVWDAVDAAVTNGETLEDFRDRVGGMLAEQWGADDASRIETIFRTNVNQAYNDGREAIFRDPEVLAERPIWRYELIDDDALCPICEACDGVILPADDAWWDDHRPILHMSCRCSFTALTEDEARDEGYATKDDGPEVDAEDGFGGGRDWDPDGSDYPAEIGQILDRVIEN